MKTTIMFRGWKARSGLALALVLAAFVVQSPRAHADQMLLATTDLVSGTSNATFSFNAPTDGTVTAHVTSIPWPTPLSSLSFSATTATDTLASWNMGGATDAKALGLGAADASPDGVETFQVGAGTYFAHIAATAGGSLNLGLYSLLLTFTPSAVPLPASDWVLLAGVIALFGLTRIVALFSSPGIFSGWRLPGLGRLPSQPVST